MCGGSTSAELRAMAASFAWLAQEALQEGSTQASRCVQRIWKWSLIV